jgi:hydroxyacylglutathione hydrolase
VQDRDEKLGIDTKEKRRERQDLVKLAKPQGGSLLVGDVARPDLLGNREETQRHAAGLCRTLQEKILKLPDHVEVYPTHVSGSLCGGSIGSRLSTTLRAQDEQTLGGAQLRNEFRRELLKAGKSTGCAALLEADAQDEPARSGAPRTLAEPPALPADEFERLASEDAKILDCRSPEAFAAHIPGAINVGLGSSFATWAGTALPGGASIVLVLESKRDLWEVCWQLLGIGYDLPKGWLSGGMMAWRTAARPLEILPQSTVWDLHRRMEENPQLLILDVRQPGEWNAGHIEGALHITGAELPSRIEDVPKDRPVATICGSGFRSSVCASLLMHHGHKQVGNVLGGMSAWRAAGLPVSRE